MTACRVPDCDRPADGDLYCRWHWRALPPALRRRLGIPTARPRAIADADAYLARPRRKTA